MDFNAELFRVDDDYPVRIYGDPVLRQKAAPVVRMSGEVRRLIADMKRIMHEANGVGLAAPQVGVSKRVIIYTDFTDEEHPVPRALIDPVIIKTGEQQEEIEEGCLSLPRLRGMVTRPADIWVKALNEQARPVRFRATGMNARVLQHEMDHLDGVLFIDRADPDTLRFLTPEELADPAYAD